MAVCLLKHISPDADVTDLVVPRFSFISDRTIVGARDKIECIEIEADAEELKPLLHYLSVAIYQARDGLFGGVFPFTIHQAKGIIGQLAREKGYWLADFAYYDAGEYEPGMDFFGLYSATPLIHPDGSIRANWRPQRRYEAYRDALVSMERDGLRELANAWWAFFIASQILAFPGFGLTGRDLRELAKQTALLMTDRMVAKAVQFAVAQEADRPSSLASRVNLALLRELATGAEETAVPQIIHLAISGAQIETYLRERIEPSVWDALSQQSQRDLIEAEQLWCRAAPDFGAGRSDWGALIALYSRPVEAEIRSHLGPFLKQLGEAGLCTVSELTLGGCLHGIREANKALRTLSFPNISETTKLKVSSLQAFFGTQACLEDYRNRANHGNREEPITATQFLKWRVAIFQDRLFAVILCGRAGSHN